MVPINIEEDLDIEDRIKKLQNGRNYLRLINEYLLASRDTQNKKIGKKYISYPVGTMVLIKEAAALFNPHSVYHMCFYVLSSSLSQRVVVDVN